MRSAIRTTATCKGCTHPFCYDRVGKRRIYCEGCAEIRRVLSKAKSRSTAESRRPQLIRYAGYDPTERGWRW